MTETTDHVKKEDLIVTRIIDAPLELEEYRATIRASDDAFRSAQNQLGLLLANHLTSAIDALISSRLSAGLHRPAALRTTYLGRRGAFVSLSIAF